MHERADDRSRQAVNALRLEVDIGGQELRIVQAGEIIRRYPVSTSAFGIGTEPGSYKTPTGRFRIAEKIGAEAPSGTVFRGRVAVENATLKPGEDAILSRILWLDGIDEDNRNTRDRFIYLHGTNDEERIGQPASHGCVRLRNADIIELFEMVPVGAEIIIRS